MTDSVYRASPIKRNRATSAEMEERAAFLIDYATAQAPVTVRGPYYQAEVAGLPGIDKSESGYRKIQAQVLGLRRAGRMPYAVIADATRIMRKPRTFDGWQDALEATAQTYRKSLWADRDVEVEIWLEKNALAGVIQPVTSEFDVPLMCTAGFSSETFAWEAVERLRGTGRTLVVEALYDFDRAGSDASGSLQEKVERFGAELGVDVTFNHLGLTLDMIRDLGLSTRAPKRATRADQRWPHDIACELDAVPPDRLRALVRTAIERQLPSEELAHLKHIEQIERDTLMDFLGAVA